MLSGYPSVSSPPPYKVVPIMESNSIHCAMRSELDEMVTTQSVPGPYLGKESLISAAIGGIRCASKLWGPASRCTSTVSRLPLPTMGCCHQVFSFGVSLPEQSRTLMMYGFGTTQSK